MSAILIVRDRKWNGRLDGRGIHTNWVRTKEDGGGPNNKTRF